VFSDGKDNIETLIKNVKKAGIDFFSVTDHDTALSGRTILGSEVLKNEIHNLGLHYVDGVEWSCICNGTKMHILAYDFDPEAPEVKRLEKEMEFMQNDLNACRLSFIEENGCKLSEKSKNYLSTKQNVRKLDFANCLVNDGYYANVDDAIQKFINKYKYPKNDRLDAAKVVQTMTSIGAKMVWAHSIHGLAEKPISYEKIEEIVRFLKPYGLAGLECYYSLYNEQEINKLLQIAEKYDLFVTAGSDYHGANKTVKLAEISSDGSKVDPKNIKLDKIFKNIIF
jgi:hypothetical protein